MAEEAKGGQGGGCADHTGPHKAHEELGLHPKKLREAFEEL